MRTLPRTRLALLGPLIAGLAVGACSSSSESARSGGGLGGSSGACVACDSAAGGTGIDVTLPPMDAGKDVGESGPTNPLCGSGCVPDDHLACADHDAGTSGAGGTSADSGVSGAAGGGAAGTAGAGGTAGSGGAAGAPLDAGPDGDAPDGSAALDAGDSMARYVDGSRPAPNPSPDEVEGAGDGSVEPGPAFGCIVKRVGSAPESVCAPAGSGQSGAPCASPSDCAAGFGCVGAASAGTCREYCCSTAESCPERTHCSEADLREDVPTGTAPLRVPVCTPADACGLGEPYPCPAGGNCTCAEGTACTVVRADGTTSCVVPGAGIAGDACPCAAGHICSAATDRCLEICLLTATDGECGAGKCQAANGFPAGFGVCVGMQADGG